MNGDWRRDPTIIEGEYEVIEERDVENGYPRPKNEGIQTDNSPPYVTYTILGINIALWLLMSFIGFIRGWNQNEQLLYFGAKANILVAKGEYWRLFTAMFLHIGFPHLFFNSYALYIYGPAVEKLFGKIKFILLYVISGLMGSMLSYLFSPYNSAGASGAIFGLMGSLLYFRREKRSLFQRVFGPGLLMIIGINLVYGFVQPGIDNWGHIGGLIGGFLIGHGLGLYKDSDKKYGQRILIWLIVILIFISGLGYGALKYGKTLNINRAYNAAQKGDISGAKGYIKKLSNRDRKDPGIKEFISAVYVEDVNKNLREKQPGKALESINELIHYYPDDPNYYFYRGQVYESAEKYERALEDYLHAAKALKDSEKVWFSAGRAAYNSGRISDAKKYLREALKIDPNFKNAKKLLDDISAMI